MFAAVCFASRLRRQGLRQYVCAISGYGGAVDFGLCVNNVH